jgi:hypothetical protein
VVVMMPVAVARDDHRPVMVMVMILHELYPRLIGASALLLIHRLQDRAASPP